MHPRTPARVRSAPLPALAVAALVLAACATGDASSAPAGPYGVGPSDGASAPSPWTESGVEAATGPVVRAGYVETRMRSRSAVTRLTLLSKGCPEVERLLRGRLVMPEAKVLSEEDSGLLPRGFRESGFEKYAVNASPDAAPQGCLGVVWLQEGNVTRSLFLMPGQRDNPATREVPDVYLQCKGLVMALHNRTPGFTVTTGSGWSDDSVFGPRTGR
jgi:hypothetical protein